MRPHKVTYKVRYTVIQKETGLLLTVFSTNTDDFIYLYSASMSDDFRGGRFSPHSNCVVTEIRNIYKKV